MQGKGITRCARFSTASEPGIPPLRLITDYAGHSRYSVHGNAPYELDVEKLGFYRTQIREVDPHQQTVELLLARQQTVRQQVNVAASTAGINPDQTSDVNNLSTPDIVTIAYEPSRDIRNLLPINPGVVQDETGQVHVAGSQTYATLDLLDGLFALQ